MRSHDTLTSLTERQLLDRFTDLVRRDHRHTAWLLAAIAEIDRRKLWAKHAYPSMFALCVERFHMSESVAAKRIWAARTARRFPVILLMLDRGELHLSAIVGLAKHLTENNHRSVLARAKHKTTREIERLVAELAPRADVPSRIRALPRLGGSSGGAGAGTVAVVGTIRSRGSGSDSGTATAGTGATQRPEQTEAGNATPGAVKSETPGSAGSSAIEDGSPPRPAVPAAPAPHGRVTPLAPRRYKLEITVDQQTHDKLRALQDLLIQRLPSADPAIIVSHAIARLLDETLAKKAALTDRPRKDVGHGDGRQAHGTRRGGRSRTIPAAVRREVWRRDGGRCTFVDEHGRRCRSTRRIEYHHEHPYATGGRHEADNVTLRCRAHNQYQADLDFGRDFMDGKRWRNDAHSARNVPICELASGSVTRCPRASERASPTVLRVSERGPNPFTTNVSTMSPERSVNDGSG